ncbi:putative cytoplasmic protein [Vibrio astriarenae]|nr:putative cytoplasmic protein [Vibrio sp. C7]
MKSMSSDYNGTSAAYARQEQGYREKALKLYPWVCGKCAQEFVYSNLRELTVHHVDHDHTNNPEDGSNWNCCACIVMTMSTQNTLTMSATVLRQRQGWMTMFQQRTTHFLT